MRLMTSLEIINQAANELGLSSTANVTSTDTQTVQLLALLNSAGNDLVMAYPWGALRKEQLLATVNGQEAYPMPADWAYYLDQTQWDRTNRWPLMGPKSAQEWQWLKSGILSQGPRMRFRVMDDRLFLFPTPGASVRNLAMEYISKNWVRNPGPPETFADRITTNDQVPELDAWLMIKFLKLKFFSAKGLNTEEVKGDFFMAFSSIAGKAKGAPILNLAPRRASILLGPYSVPEGNWPVP